MLIRFIDLLPVDKVMDSVLNVTFTAEQGLDDLRQSHLDIDSLWKYLQYLIVMFEGFVGYAFIDVSCSLVFYK